MIFFRPKRIDEDENQTVSQRALHRRPFKVRCKYFLTFTFPFYFRIIIVLLTKRECLGYFHRTPGGFLVGNSWDDLSLCTWSYVHIFTNTVVQVCHQQESLLGLKVNLTLSIYLTPYT